MVELNKMLDRLSKHRDWECMDTDCLQYQHRISNDEYVMIQLMWLDTVKEEAEYEEGIIKDYIVVGDVVNLKDEDFELAISGYYDSLDAMKEVYGLEIEDLKPFIAECAFEQQRNYWYVSDLMTEEAAEHLIKMYLDACGKGE